MISALFMDLKHGPSMHAALASNVLLLLPGAHTLVAQGLVQQVVESSMMGALPSEQQFSLRMLLPRKPEQAVPYAPYSPPPAPLPQGFTVPQQYRVRLLGGSV